MASSTFCWVRAGAFGVRRPNRRTAARVRTAPRPTGRGGSGGRACRTRAAPRAHHRRWVAASWFLEVSVPRPSARPRGGAAFDAPTARRPSRPLGPDVVQCATSLPPPADQPAIATWTKPGGVGVPTDPARGPASDVCEHDRQDVTDHSSIPRRLPDWSTAVPRTGGWWSPEQQGVSARTILGHEGLGAHGSTRQTWRSGIAAFQQRDQVSSKARQPLHGSGSGVVDGLHVSDDGTAPRPRRRWSPTNTTPRRHLDAGTTTQQALRILRGPRRGHPLPRWTPGL